jgi:hypothetical protein
MSPLHVSGQWIEDSSGNRIQLRGSGFCYDFYGFNSARETDYINWMKSTGCDCVRLAFIMPDTGGWESYSMDQYDASSMNETINLLAANGIPYVIFQDFDYYGTVNGGNAILPNYYSYWLADWVSIANTFKNNPHVAMYELMNEGEYMAPTAWMESAYANCTAAIRATGDNHIIMLWGGDYFQDKLNPTAAGQIASLPSGGNIVLDWHESFQSFPCNYAFFDDDIGAGDNTKGDYWGFTALNDTNQYIAAEYFASTLVSGLALARSVMGCPVMAGEIENYNYSMGTPDAYYNALCISMCEQNGISWNIWSFDGMYVNENGNTNGLNYWGDLFNRYLGGAFTSNYVFSSVPQNPTYNASTFSALPFNLMQHANYNSAFSSYGYSYINPCLIIGNDAVGSFNITGPCMIDVVCWDSTGVRTGTISYTHIYTLTSGQSVNIISLENSYGLTCVYPWSNSIATIIPINGD